jgi:hypothetical protein
MKKVLVIILCIIGIKVDAQKLAITELGRYTDGRVTASEIVTYDSSSKKLFITNAVSDSIDIVDISNPGTPVRVGGISISPYGSGVNSVVALRNGHIAAAIEANVLQDSGKVVFFTTNGAYVNQLKVGALPDMITISPNGKKVLVAGEGEPNSTYTNDPKGTIAIIDISNGIATLNQNNVKILNFDSAPSSIVGSLKKPLTTWANDLEPEYICVNESSTLASVVCQEANVMVLVDLTADTIKSYKGLGFKDYTLAGNGMDASDKDSKVNIKNHPVKGVYMPDAVAAYTVAGSTYFVTANEGDSREYSSYVNEVRIKSVSLDTTVFPNATALKQDSVLGRLKILTKDVIGDTDGDGDYDELYCFGARSFSIWNQTGTLVWDSKNAIEKFFETNYLNFFNCNEGKASLKDDRSDDKGPEPEALTIGTIDNRFYAFIGLERQGGILIYDITVPTAPVFEKYISPFKVDGTSTDAGVEGLVFVPAKQSHTGKNLLIASHEVSGTTTIFQIDDLFPTNIEKQASINNISIFPNPSQSNITITVQNFATTSKIKIVNSFGQLMHQQEMKEKSIQLPIMHLANGVYNVIISDETNDANIQTSTFVKY